MEIATRQKDDALRWQRHNQHPPSTYKFSKPPHMIINGGGLGGTGMSAKAHGLVLVPLYLYY